MKDPYNRHPAADFLFYALAVFYTAKLKHPVFLAINFTSALVYSIMLDRKKAFKLLSWICVPVFTIITVSNTAFSHYGITTLAILASGNRITFEAIVSGAVSGIQVISLILWFFCFSAVVTQEKHLHIFGRISPRLALFAMLILRFIPLYTKQLKAAYDIHKGAKNSFTAFFSAIVTVLRLAVEKSFDTADSMKARGYGLKPRTSYSRFYFAVSDVAAVTTASVFAAATAFLHRLQPANALYNPIIIIGRLTPTDTAAAVFYALLCTSPILLYSAFLIKPR